MNSLFPEVQDERALLAEATEAYALELLEHPPVGCLAVGNMYRERSARTIAKKDVTRLVKALDRIGLVIVREGETR